ncbi:RNA 2',3'-cyclic phosphodiesterase [Paenibacillus sp. J2TS4]|uniref:RNA 2',3'-cyclic phosphodiesterase n=1 Tax=Paenibacillus sp. J2TS4 TaxID=2807194 RepID=UPI001B20E76A|nr:RNA 2',3'-cyclic phosphodiesterase [Paenibacillus sp. J2TS4]GIP34306.1 RNA 2',3'-cyclic phosphodiesterase [Paenibacillus sp. J2TS4]
MSTARLFIAAPISPSVKNTLERWTRTLAGELPFRKWTHPDDYHITLQFLGETSAEKQRQVEQALRFTAERHPNFSLTLNGLGLFGPEPSPQILWAGAEGDTSALRSLQQDVVEAMCKVGYEAESRPYRPHITLARKYAGPSPFERSKLKSAPQPEAGVTSWLVNEVVLYQSHSGKRPMYEPLSAFPLTQAMTQR